MATPDIFSRNVEYGGAFSADGAAISFTWGTGPNDGIRAGMMSQRITWQYGQQITRLYELESPKVYLVAGRTQGALTLDTVLGPKRLMKRWYTQFGDVCNSEKNNITFKASVGCGDPAAGGGSVAGTSAVIRMEHCVIERLSGAVAAENMVIQSNVSMIFLRLNMEDEGESYLYAGGASATLAGGRFGAGGGG